MVRQSLYSASRSVLRCPSIVSCSSSVSSCVRASDDRLCVTTLCRRRDRQANKAAPPLFCFFCFLLQFRRGSPRSDPYCLEACGEVLKQPEFFSPTPPSRASQAQAAHTPCLVPDRPLGASSRSMLRVPSHFPHARRTTESTNLTSVPAEAGRHSCPPTAPAVYPLNGSPKPVQCVEVCSPLSVNRVLQQLCLILCTRIR
jgi:hypothetical protein